MRHIQTQYFHNGNSDRLSGQRSESALPDLLRFPGVSESNLPPGFRCNHKTSDNNLSNRQSELFHPDTFERTPVSSEDVLLLRRSSAIRFRNHNISHILPHILCRKQADTKVPGQNKYRSPRTRILLHRQTTGWKAALIL